MLFGLLALYDGRLFITTFYFRIFPITSRIGGDFWNDLGSDRRGDNSVYDDLAKSIVLEDTLDGGCVLGLAPYFNVGFF